MNSERIGKVKLTTLLDNTSAVYSDGEIEDKLLELFAAPKPNLRDFSVKNPSWATTYHLSPVRQNLLNWYDFPSDSSVLEVGAGCGAITELLAKNAGNVTALELSERRAKVNAHRNKTNANLEVVVGNLENFKTYTTEKFDFVVCIGVLEYAGRFISGDTPFESFLDMLKAHLNPNGTLILAIENKLGLKYFSGSREDHVQRYMESIEDYPHFDGIRTFGKRELSTLFNKTGFKELNFYFPLPDYKLPHTIYSDEYLPGVHTEEIPSYAFPTPNPDQEREQIFREQLAVRSIANNGLYGELANSFLVFAHLSPKPRESRVVYSHGAVSRLPEFATITRIRKSGKSLSVEKLAASDKSSKHISRILKNNKLLASNFSDTPSIKVNAAAILKTHQSAISLEHVGSPSLQEQLIGSLTSHNFTKTEELIDAYISVIDTFKTKTMVASKQAKYVKILGKTYNAPVECVLPGFLDLNFDNILLRGSGDYELIDYEWTYEFAVPKKLLISRALIYFFTRHHQIVRALCAPNFRCIELGENFVVPQSIYKKYRQYFTGLNEVIKAETNFQKYVLGESKKSIKLHKKPIIHATELTDNTIQAYKDSQIIVEAYHENLQLMLQQQRRIDELETRLSRIVASMPWRVLRKTKSAVRRLRG